MDVQICRVIKDKDSTVLSREPAQPEDKVICRVYKEVYSEELGKFTFDTSRKDQDTFMSITPKQLKSLIREEVNVWPEYDKYLEKQKKQGPRRAKRRLPFTMGSKKSKMPKIRILSKYDRTAEAHSKVNKEIQQLTWAQGKLMYAPAFAGSFKKKPHRIAGVMFAVMSKEEVTDVALQLLPHCKPEDLHKILDPFRFKVLDQVADKYHDKCKDAIALNQELQVQRKEHEDGPCTADAWPMEDVAVMNDDATVMNDDAGPEQVADQVAGPEQVADQVAGPEQVVVGADDAGPMQTPALSDFVPLSHWIKSARSSSGYKGVMKDGRGGWRAKHGGSTIGRFPTKEEACEAYYNSASLSASLFS